MVVKEGSGQSSKFLMAGVAAAIAALQDPRTRQQIVDASSSVAAGVKDWKDRRDRRGLEGLGSRLTSSFGNRNLERRVENLGANVELLRTNAGPEAQEALGEVNQAVDRLHVAVAMAGNLPFWKRQKAHRDIGAVLGELEKALFSQAMN